MQGGRLWGKGSRYKINFQIAFLSVDSGVGDKIEWHGKISPTDSWLQSRIIIT